MLLERVTYTGRGGLKLAADRGGDPSHPAVVLLHGGGQTRHSWGGAARDLVQFGYHVVSMDLRGHGDSDWASDGAYDIEDYVGDLEAVIATLESPPALVGASLGGVTSLVLVGESVVPRASALVLVDVVPRMEGRGVEEIKQFMQANPDGFASLEEAADAVARYIPNRPRPPSSDGLKKNLRRRDDGRYYWHWDPRMHQGHHEQGVVRMSERMEAAARQVTIPTLLVRGAQSNVVSEEGVDHLRELIPHAEHVEVGGAGHMVAGDRNDQFNASVEVFLRRTVQIG